MRKYKIIFTVNKISSPNLRHILYKKYWDDVMKFKITQNFKLFEFYTYHFFGFFT
jgi:hypothetical protein